MYYWNQEERELNKDRYKTAPFDPRFPYTNQSRRCFLGYVDYWKCVQAKGPESSDCEPFALTYKSMCPLHLIEQWNEQRDEGTFPVRDLNNAPPKF